MLLKAYLKFYKRRKNIEPTEQISKKEQNRSAYQQNSSSLAIFNDYQMKAFVDFFNYIRTTIIKAVEANMSQLIIKARKKEPPSIELLSQLQQTIP